MRVNHTLPDYLRLATKDDFRENGYFKQWKVYYKYFFGDGSFEKEITFEDTNREDLKLQILFENIYVLKSDDE